MLRHAALVAAASSRNGHHHRPAPRAPRSTTTIYAMKTFSNVATKLLWLLLTAAVLFLAPATNALAQRDGTPLIVTTNPSPPKAGQPYQVEVTGYLIPNLAGSPEGPTVTVSGGSITVFLNRNCGFLCPGYGISTQTFTAPALPSGNYVMTIYQGGPPAPTPQQAAIVPPDGVLAFSVPLPSMQDLWWSGLGENGWGMSIVQHRDVLFANMFVFDSNGAPTWYVMPSGIWNTAHTAYTGSLYLPTGAPFYAYDGTKFDIGAAVGTATLTFADANNATFDYTINGVTGHKTITRLLFGPQSPPLDKPLGDLWWAGSQQNGWGIALIQQYSSLFGLWFTYDANGKAIWYVMPSGSWVMTNDWQGKIYRADGPPWLGVTYDPTRLQLTEVGTFRYRFSGDGATFDYTVGGTSGTINLSRIPF